MTTHTDAMLETPASPPAPAPSHATRPLYWSVRREIWENRSVYIAPLAVAAVILVGFAISTIGMPHRRLVTLTLDPAKQAAVIGQPYDFAAIALIVTMGLVAVFYCLGALYGERRDRTVLFWRSLPVSDHTAVLAKAIVPLAVLPAIVFVVVPVVQLVMLAWSTAVLLASGVSAALPWTLGSAVQGPIVLLYGLATLSLWNAPVYGWLLLVSAWARRTPLLWAVLPPLALCLFEKLAFGTGYLAHVLGHRLSGGYEEAFAAPEPGALKATGGIPAVGVAQLDPLKFLGSPDLWVGLAVAVAFFAATVWLRRRREPN